MFENFEDQAWDLLKNLRKISPHLLMRKFNINFDAAFQICIKIWLRQHIEARKLMKEYEEFD